MPNEKLIDREALKTVREKLQQRIENGQIIAGKSLTTKAINPVSEESGTIQETPFISQGTATANNTSPVDTSPVGKQLEKQGNTIVYNQLTNFNYSNSTMGVSFIGTHLEVDTGERVVAILTSQNLPNPIPTGHKVLNLIVCKSGNYATTSSSINFGGYHTESGNTSWQGSLSIPRDTDLAGKVYSSITTTTNTATDLMFFINNGTINVTTKIEAERYFIDLTKWFNGDIPQDLLDHPEHFSWYYNGDLSYSAGEIRNCAGRYLECGQGRNVWDEEWEVGGIDNSTGALISAGDFIRTKNYIRIIPNTTYYRNSTVDATRIFFYDVNYNYISNVSILSTGGTFTTPDNAIYILFKQYGTTYHNDITISLYYSTGEGYDEYYPYVAPIVYDTGTEVLRKAGGVKDTKAPDGTITRRVGQVDLGTLTWNSNSGTYPTDSFYSQDFGYNNNGKLGSYNLLTVVEATRCNINPSSKGSLILVVSGQTYQTAAEFKTAMSGKLLYYELATPTTEQGTAFSENIQINDYGDMGWLDTNEDLVSIPQGTKLFYPADYVLLIDSLNSYTNGDVTSLAKKSDLVNKQDKLTQSTDLTPTTQTLTLVANTRYALGTLTALGLTFPASANDGDEIIIEFVSGSTATTLTLDNVNAIYNFNSVNLMSFVELSAKYSVSMSKWVVNSTETITADPILENNSWATIKAVFKAGIASIYWAVGDEKTVAVADGYTYKVRIADMAEGRYAYSDGSGFSNNVFEFVKLLATDRQMNSTNTNVGGFADCEMRTALNTTVYNQLPADLKAVISEVSIKSGIGNSTTSGTTASDNKLFLASEYEIFGAKTYSIGASEGSPQFGYWALHNSNADRIKTKINSTSVQSWWLRSPHSGYSTSFCRVTTVGYANLDGAYVWYCVCPFFVL